MDAAIISYNMAICMPVWIYVHIKVTYESGRLTDRVGLGPVFLQIQFILVLISQMTSRVLSNNTFIIDISGRFQFSMGRIGFGEMDPCATPAPVRTSARITHKPALPFGNLHHVQQSLWMSGPSNDHIINSNDRCLVLIQFNLGFFCDKCNDTATNDVNRIQGFREYLSSPTDLCRLLEHERKRWCNSQCSVFFV